jgi:ubiquinone/menaquinone biosynthesis C-methylase UbiE
MSFQYLWQQDKYKTLLINLILKSGGRYVLTKTELETLLYKNYDDERIYKKLRRLAKREVLSKSVMDHIRSRTKRAKIRFEEIMKIPNIGPYMTDIIRYLDFGAGDGSMAVLLGKQFQAKNVYAIDISEWNGSLFDSGIYKDKCNFRTYDGKSIPFKTNSFDLITTFQVLHHIESIETILSELYRVLCHGGMLIIREHNCHSDNMYKLIEIEHELHNKVFNPQINEKEAYSCYRPKNMLKQLFVDAGFEYIGQHCMKDEVWNPTRYYYQAYLKN